MLTIFHSLACSRILRERENRGWETSLTHPRYLHFVVIFRPTKTPLRFVQYDAIAQAFLFAKYVRWHGWLCRKEASLETTD